MKIHGVIQAVGEGGGGERGVRFTGRIDLGVICVAVKTNTKFMERIAEWEEEDDEEGRGLGHSPGAHLKCRGRALKSWI